jgi:hypothetical protein
MSAGIAVRAACVWTPTPAQQTPDAALLPPRMRSRASLLTRMLAEVVGNVAQAGGVDPAALPLIVGSRYGEIATTARLLRMMNAEGGALSPLGFQASVHNTAAGQISIAGGGRGFSTCLAAGEATCAAVLLEAWGWLQLHGGSAIAALADEPLPEFFDAEGGFPALAGALLLSAEPSGRVLASLGPPSYRRSMGNPDSKPPPAHDPELSRNPVAPVLDLLAALHADAPGRVELPAAPGAWSFEVVPAGQAR